MNLNEVRQVGSSWVRPDDPWVQVHHRNTQLVTDVMLNIPIAEFYARPRSREQVMNDLMHTACSLIRKAFADE